jgi:hypothetical protein
MEKQRAQVVETFREDNCMNIVINTKSLGKTYEISELITKISFDDKLNDGCSKLEFSYINDELIIENGDEVLFEYETIAFVGRVFNVSRDLKKEISVTAYDQLRYAKGKDYLTSKNDTITTLVNKMCMHFNFSKGVVMDTGYVLKSQLFDNQTWLDIVYSGISETLTNKSKWYVLRDEGGKITLRDMEDLSINLVLGDQSLCYEYSYEKSIDDEFYNQIMILSKGSEDSGSEFICSKEEKSIRKYGMLQYFEILDNSNSSKAKAKADALLSLYNSEKQNLSLDCIGDSRVRAGNSLYFQIKDLKFVNKMVVKSVTHDFLPVHTMKLEVML